MANVEGETFLVIAAAQAIGHANALASLAGGRQDTRGLGSQKQTFVPDI